MAAQYRFIFLFVLGSIKNQPVCCWIADAIAEYQIEPPPDFVDEVVHVAIETAVIVAGKDHPFLIVQKNPAGGMDSGNSCEMAAEVNVAGGVFDHCQQKCHGQAPE